MKHKQNSRLMTATLPQESLDVFRDMGELGMRLLVPKANRSWPRLVPDPRYEEWYPDAPKKARPVSPVAVAKLIEAGWIGRLTEHRNNNKIGWREMGLDGKTNEVYCCVQ